MTTTTLPVAIIGAGPVGLAAAAHLAERGQPFVILEASPTIAAHLESYRHVRLFSPWRYNIDAAAARLLARSGWQRPDDETLPTAAEMIDRYLAPLAQQASIAASLRLGTRVTRVARAGFDKVKTEGRERAPFLLQLQTSLGTAELRASAVLDASGTWGTPNPIGASGLPVDGEAEFHGRIHYGMPDVLGARRAEFTGRHVLVLGSGHSAAGTLVALAELAERDSGTRISWAVRGDDLKRAFGGGEADGLPARGALGTRLRLLLEAGRLQLYKQFRVRALRADGAALAVVAEDGRRIGAVDRIVAATGSRPDLGLARELRVRLDAWLESTDALAPLIDPNLHSCGTVRPHGHRELAHPEPGFYIVGAKSYGRAPNFLLATGYEQVRSVVAALAGDLAAADAVQLDLPQTGVCSVSFGEARADTDAACCVAEPAVNDACCDGAARTESSGCCGGPAPTGSDACCLADSQARAKGEAGCGCTAEGPAPARATRACATSADAGASCATAAPRATSPAASSCATRCG